MIISWMTYGVVVGVLLATTAWAMDALLRMIGAPVRWVWSAALIATLVFIAAAPRQRVAPSMLPVSTVVMTSEAGAQAPRAPNWRLVALAATRDLDARLSTELRSGIATVETHVPPRIAPWCVVAWLVGGVLLALLFTAVQLRYRRARRYWPAADLHGVRVRVSPAAGPAVIGLTHPEIVIPHWLLGRNRDEQRLVLAHEVEHVRAHDPILLALGWLTLMLVPWSPAVWWMVSRLRLAVELDCDARVLRRGAPRFAYGMLLIDLAEYCSGLRVGAPALADDASHLHTRLNAMHSSPLKFARARASVVVLLAASALVVACEARLPTSADVDSMTVASAERGVNQMMTVRDTNVTYTIDGLVATAAQAHALVADSIVRINILKAANGAEFRITTRKAAELAAVDSAARRARLYGALSKTLEKMPSFSVQPDLVARNGGVVINTKTSSARAGSESTFVRGMARMQAFTGLVFIDGVKRDPSVIKTLDRNSIKSVEVIKGAAAAARYRDPAAAGGVIEITTKAGAGSK